MTVAAAGVGEDGVAGLERVAVVDDPPVDEMVAGRGDEAAGACVVAA